MTKNKETYYFSHDYNARNDQRILQLRFKFGWEGYGIYWALLETMAEDEIGDINREAIGGLSIGYSIPIDRLTEIITCCINLGLFLNDGNIIYSPRMTEHKKHRKAFVEAGKKGAKIRWENSPPNSPPNSKERKGKERKEYKEEPPPKKEVKKAKLNSEFFEYYNDVIKVYDKIPKALKLTPSRIVKLNTRFEEKLFAENWKDIIDKICDSDHLQGINDRGWTVSFDWIIENEKNYIKILENKYKFKG